MKKFLRVFILSVAGLFVLTSISNAAVLTCATMQITKVSATSFWAKNTTGDACGAVAADKQIYLTFSPAATDRLLAIALTAVSLQKDVWVHAGGDVNGSVVDIISITP